MIASADERPNIVLVMADDQGWGDVGFRDHPALLTPVMDELAAQAIRFDRFYAAAPVCSPTRGSVLTGRHPNRFGCFSWGHRIKPQEITLAEYLQEAGYDTGHFGKWHLGSVEADAPTSPGNNGFRRWVSAPNFYENSPLLSDEGTVVETSGEGSEVTVDFAIDFIRQAANKKTPFLAVVWFGSPHAPHQALEADRKPYEQLPEKTQHFLGEITAMDRAVGKLRTALRDHGVSDNTLFWYSSDNGALPVGSSGGLRGRKSQVYEGGIRVPAMLEWPARFPNPMQCDIPVTSSDMLPTVLAAVGIEPDQERPLDGVNILPWLDSPESAPSRGLGFWVHPTRGIGTPSHKILEVLLAKQRVGGTEGETLESPIKESDVARANQPQGELFSGKAAWIEGSMKLIATSRRDQQVTYELYDLSRDAGETNNLKADHSDKVESMARDLRLWQESVVNSLQGRDYSAPVEK